MGEPKFVPKTVYVTYIAATPEKVWQALTSPEFTKQYFFGRTVEIEQKVGGSFILRMPDGRVDVEGKVMECDPPRRLSVTWRVMWIEAMRKLPDCLVTYQIDALGDAVRLTMSESHQWDVPDDILAGGRMGWPLILSSLKSLVETGKPIVVKMEPPKDMLEAVKRATDGMPRRSNPI
jgi:uncharacterized protein YndB with AHSA1/START domain